VSRWPEQATDAIAAPVWMVQQKGLQCKEKALMEPAALLLLREKWEACSDDAAG
jgi:hypothetical protein